MDKRGNMITYTIGPTIKVGDSFIKSNVSITLPYNENLDADVVLDELSQHYYRTLERDVEFVKLFDGRSATALLKKLSGLMEVEEEEENGTEISVSYTHLTLPTKRIV